MANAGLSFANPFLSKEQVGAEANPYAPYSPTSQIGMGGLAPSAADMAVLGQSMVQQNQFRMPEMKAPPAIAYSPTQRKIFVQGTVFDEDDAQSALQSESLLSMPSTGLPTEGDWVSLAPDEYGQFLQSIRSPSRGRLFKKGFATGVQQLKQLGGSAIQLLGAEETGGDIVASAQREIEKRSPFQREFTDVDSATKFVDWFVANLGTQGPMLLESVAAGLIGAGAGTAAAGPGVGTAGGFIAGVFGKQAFKKKVLDAADKYRAGQITKDSAEYALLRNASALTGAVAANYASSAVIGAGDIYGEMREQGVGADDLGARFRALAGSLPYAAAESLPEFFIAGRLLGAGGRAALPTGASKLRRGVEYGLVRPAQGAAVFGAAEGTTELFQEGLVMGLSGQDLTSEEAVKRFVNAFAAGAAIGGVLGGVANLRSRKSDGTPAPESKEEINLLDNPPPAVPVSAPQMQAGTMGRPDFVAGEEGVRASRPGDTLYTGEVAPGQFGGPQGVLDLGGAPIQELQQRSRETGALPPQQVWNPETVQWEYQERPGMVSPLDGQPIITSERAALPAPAVAPDPRQGVLQFAPEAPSGVGFTDQQPVPNTLMAQQMQIAQRRQQEDQARQQRAQQEAQERARQENLMLAQQQVQIAEQAERDRRAQEVAASLQTPLPMVPVQPRTPQQLSLFSRREAPVPSRAEGLRRGVGTALPLTEAPAAPLTAAQRRAQIPLFTQRGEPSVAALKSAARKEPVAAPTPEVGATQVKPTGKKVTPASVAKAKAEAAQKEAERKEKAKQAAEKLKAKAKKEKDDAVQKPSAASVDAQEQSGDGKEVRGRDTEGRKATGKAEALKKGKAKTEGKTKADKVTPAPAVIEPLSPAEAWDDMGPDGAPAFEQLPKTVQTEWVKLVADNKASMQAAFDLYSDVDLTPLQLVEADIRTFEEATGNSKGKIEALRSLVRTAYFTSEETNTKPAVTRARKYMATIELSDSEKQVVDSEVVAEVNSKQRLEATYKGSDRAGQPKPWFDWAMRRGLLPQINTTIVGLDKESALGFVQNSTLRLANFPDTTQKFITDNMAGPAPTAPAAQDKRDTKSNAAKELSDYIRELNTRDDGLNKRDRDAAVKRLAALWQSVQDAGMEDFLDQNGVRLEDYFDVDGQPITNQIKGKMRVGTEVLTKEKRKQVETQMDERQDDDADYEAPFSLDDWNYKRFDDGDGRWFRDDGTPINNPVPMGRVRLLVANFLSKLGIKPKVGIYRNQADLKTKNPALYARAVAARPQGDFDTASAVGYSFGDGEVLIFTDRVATERQLQFVLAHETLGHFGFRGLMTEKQLNAALDAVYNSSPKIKAAVDTAMDARPMSRREATEEYLADFAGSLDTNVLARFWNAIKNALNKLGIRFEDDMARYIVSQSRRYVSNGTTSGSFVDFKAMADRMGAIERMDDPDGTGRFALAGPYYDETNHIAADSFIGRRSQGFFDLSNFMQQAKARGINARDFGERVLSELKTMNYSARDNQGYRRLYEILRETVRTATELRSKYNNMMRTVLRPSIQMLGKQWTDGASRSDIDAVNRMLNVTSRIKHGQLTDNELRKLGSLIDIADGEARVNEDVFKALRKRGMITLEQFQKGFTYTELRERAMTEAKKAEIIKERDAALVGVEDAQERKAIEREYKDLIEAPSATYEVEVQYPAMPGLTEDSAMWKMYNEVRATMDESAIDLLMANFAAAKGEQNRIQSVAQSLLDRELTDDDKVYLEKISDKFLALRSEGAKVNDKGQIVITQEAENLAQKFVASWNEALLANERDKYQALLGEFFEGAAYDDAVLGLDALKEGSKIPKKGQERFAIQQAIQNLALTETSKTDAEMLAKRSITGGYVPFGREGLWQVRIQVVDPKTGRVYKASDDYRKQLMFVQVDSRAEAERIAENTNNLFGDTSEDSLFDIEVFDDGEYKVKRVKLLAQPEAARETVSTTSEANLNEVVQTLTRFGVNITPTERKRLIVGMTRQNARARTRLQRLGTPGEDPNTIKYVSQHLESTASTVARKQNRHRLDKLFTDGDPESERLWRGDQVEYDRRKAAWKAAQNNPGMPEPLRKAIKRDFDDYHRTFVVKESPVMANRYKDRGRRLVAFLESQTSVEFTDFASNEAGSQLRMWTTFAQLGGSFATGLLNVIALNTNVLPAMAGYNAKTSFGGGFGWGQSAVSLTNAMNQVKNPSQSDVKFWNDLLADPKKLQASGFTEAEARFMQKEVSAGSMQAALFNALLGSARGKVTSGAGQAAVRAWMGLFSYTEQAARRATGLATFRLSYERATQEGKAMGLEGEALQKFAFDKADQFAVDMIDNTLGEYAMFNRPSFFRGDVRQFLFIYKMFPVNSVLMLSQLDRKTQLLALGILVAYAGLKGLPFAEDFMDILDTIAQGLGLGPGKVWKGSAERTVLEALDAIAPGWTPALWRGVLNQITPANVSDRVSLSNLFPGTGIGLSGANVGRELLDIAGPLASFLQGSVVTAGNIAKYGLETVGLKDDTTSLTGILRESPVTMLRAMGDMRAYNNAGAIVNQKGYIVSEDLHWGTYLTRTLGFYPAAAVRENDVVRVANRLANYQRDIAATYRGMYVAARIANNPDKAAQVVDMVRDWNESARGTGLEIRNFVGSANRALREARRPASERFLKSAPKGLRPETERLQYLFGADDD